jgi:hypothetical protein
MKLFRLFALALVCALTFAAPHFVEAAGGGAATNLTDEGICFYRCNNGSVGSGPVNWPYGRNCLNLCAAACGGPCIALY